MSKSSIHSQVCRLDETLQPKLDILRVITKQLALHSGFLEATLNNPNQEKIQGSFAGHIVDAQVRASAHVCIMAICRFWDKDMPLELVRSIAPHVTDIEAIRKSAHPDWPHNALELGTLVQEIQKSEKIARDFLKSPEYGHIRTFRTEMLAHNDIGPSRDRKRLLGLSVQPVTKYTELVRASVISFEVFDRLVSHWEFHIEDSMSLFQICKSYAKIYWDALPVFHEVENVGLMDT